MHGAVRRGTARALLLGLFLAGSALAKSPPPKVHAPPFTLPTSNGTVCLDSLRGQTVLVDFWASWCGPCKQSFPWMTTMQQKYGAKGLAIVAVNLDKDRNLADEFLDRHEAPFTVAFDPSGKTAKDYKVHGMPSSFLVAPDGSILFTHAGFDPKKTGDLERMIQEACRR